jgi:hypothetical protein
MQKIPRIHNNLNISANPKTKSKILLVVNQELRWILEKNFRQVDLKDPKQDPV